MNNYSHKIIMFYMLIITRDNNMSHCHCNSLIFNKYLRVEKLYGCFGKLLSDQFDRRKYISTATSHPY